MQTETTLGRWIDGSIEVFILADPKGYRVIARENDAGEVFGVRVFPATMLKEAQAFAKRTCGPDAIEV